MAAYPEKRDEVDKVLFQELGRHYNELSPEAWYDAKWIKMFLDKYVAASITGISAMTTFGRKIYPTIRALLPAHLKTPLDYLKFESDTYLRECRGPDVKARTILKAVEGEFKVETALPAFHHPKFIEGLYTGILEMCGAKGIKVKFSPLAAKGQDAYLFEVFWQA